MSVRPRIPGQTSRSTLSGLPANCRTAASVETSIFSGPIRPSAWTVHDAGVDDPQPADTKTASTRRRRFTGVYSAPRALTGRVEALATAPIILVPGFWLGAWAWDEVAAALRADGHEVTAVTLPGLESADADRSAITLADHVDAICDAVTAAGRPVVLAVHSGAGAPGYAVTDRIPDQIAAMVYVDTGPARGALDPNFDAVEKPMPSLEKLAAEENLDGLTKEQLATFRRRAVSEPGAALRGSAELTNDARLDVPSTVICTGYTSAQYKDAVKEGQTWLGGLSELRNVTYLDLPTSHWPMWSRPKELAVIIGEVAERASERGEVTSRRANAP